MGNKSFLILDIGTTAIKALIFKVGKQRGFVLGTSLRPFDQFSVWDSKDFEMDVIKKAVSKAVQEVKERTQAEIHSVIVGLPATILKARVTNPFLIRDAPKKLINEKEEKSIRQTILRKGQKKVSQTFTKLAGILPQHLQFFSPQILETKIDGYPVPYLQGYSGKKLEFKVLITSCPKFHFENYQKIIEELGLKIANITHLSKNLIQVFKTKRLSAVFCDIGGKLTQIFLIKDGKLEAIDELGIGGEAFSEALSQRLGLKVRRARILKGRYSKGLLSEKVQKRIKQIFLPLQREWFSNFKQSLRATKTRIPSTIYLFGGGGQLPEIKEILEGGDWTHVPLISALEVKFLYPQDILKVAAGQIEDKTRTLNTPQYTSSLLFCYAKKKNF